MSDLIRPRDRETPSTLAHLSPIEEINHELKLQRLRGVGLRRGHQVLELPALIGGWVSESSMLGDLVTGAPEFRNVVVTEDGAVRVRAGYRHKGGNVNQVTWENTQSVEFGWNESATIQDYQGWHTPPQSDPQGIGTGTTRDANPLARARWFKAAARGNIQVSITARIPAGSVSVVAYRTTKEPNLSSDYPTWSRAGIAYQGGLSTSRRALASGEPLTITWADVRFGEYIIWLYFPTGALTYLAKEIESDPNQNVYVQADTRFRPLTNKTDPGPTYVQKEEHVASRMTQQRVTLSAPGGAVMTRIAAISADTVLASNPTGGNASVLKVGEAWTQLPVGDGVTPAHLRLGPDTPVLPYKTTLEQLCFIGSWEHLGSNRPPVLLTVGDAGVTGSEVIEYRPQTQNNTVAHDFTVANESEDVQRAIISKWSKPVIYRQRLLWLAEGSFDIYFSPPGSPFGEYDLFSLDGQFDQASTRVVWAGPLSQDTAEGGREVFLAISDAGSVVVYEGDVGGSDLNIVGRYSMPAPLNNHSIVKVGGDVLVASAAGLYSVTAEIQTRGADVTSRPLSAVIDKKWRERVAQLTDGWRLLHDPNRNWLYVYHPDRAAMVYQIGRKVWSEFSPYEFMDMAVADRRVVATKGRERLYELNTGGSDDGEAYNVVLRSSFFTTYGMDTDAHIAYAVVPVAFKGTLEIGLRGVDAFEPVVEDHQLNPSRARLKEDIQSYHCYWSPWQRGQAIPETESQTQPRWSSVPRQVERDSTGAVVRTHVISGFPSEPKTAWQWYDYDRFAAGGYKSITQKTVIKQPVGRRPLIALEIQARVRSNTALDAHFQGAYVYWEAKRAHHAGGR